MLDNKTSPEDSSLYSCSKDCAGGDNEVTRSTSHANWCNADCKRSGRKACTKSTRWNEDTDRMAGKSRSHSGDVAHLCHLSRVNGTGESKQRFTFECLNA